MRKTEGDVKSQNPSFDPEFEEVGVSVVVPAYNEAEIIVPLMQELSKMFVRTRMSASQAEIYLWVTCFIIILKNH